MYIKKLNLQNFKKIKNLQVEFGEDGAVIKGKNGTGKSTIMDAFMWLLFGKDSHDRSAFEIQTLDEKNNVIHGLTCSVSAVLDVDGKEKVLKRTLEERWVKPKGKAEKELKGTTTSYMIDEIPQKQKEYQAAISDIVNEDLFKMITNPLYFSSLNWTKQREILLEIIGDLEDENVIAYNKKLEPLKQLLSDDNIDDFNKKIKAKISELKDKVKSIPFRIDECNNSILNADFSELELKKAHIQSEINKIDEQIADVSKANEGKLKLQDQLYKVKEELSKKLNEASQKANEPINNINNSYNKLSLDIHNKRGLIDNLTFKRDRNIHSLEDLDSKLNEKREERKKLLEEYHSEENKTFEFDISLSKCPHCGREYEQDKITEIEENAQASFLIAKKKSLDNILRKGKNTAAEIEKIEDDIKNIDDENKSLNIEISSVSKEVNDLQVKLDNLDNQRQSIDFTKEIQFEGQEELKAEIEELKKQIEDFQEADNSELKAKKRILQSDLEEVTKQLGKKDTNEDLRKRIEELNQEEKDLQVTIAKLEGQQFLADEFIRTKVELLEESINKKFKGAVTFKLFNQQVNGGLSETCEALINGVPFGDANTAARINAGLSIINTLCEHYNVTAPIFVDNAEAVNELQHTDSQLIKLIVSKDKELKVEVEK